MTPLICALCGAQSHDVRHGIVRWDDLTFQDVDRCEDRASCRARVEAAGDHWPVLDPVTA